MFETKSGLDILIVGFLIIVLGAVFLGVLSDNNWLHRNTYNVENETLTAVSNLTTVDIANHPIAEILYVTNATGDYVLVPVNNYTDTTTSIYNLYNGKFILTEASEYNGEDLNISYTYYPAGYVRQSTAQVLLNLIPLFFVIAILLFVVYPILKRFEVF